MNYYKTAYRSLKKNKGFTAINILGLAIGLATCLLILFYVFDELSYDRYNTKADRIYRVNEDLKLGNNAVQYSVCMAPLAQVLVKDFPEVENAVRIKKAGLFHIKKNGSVILDDEVIYADAAVFDVFTLPMINGDSKSALKEPNSIVLTESTAKKYFNTTDIVGRDFTPEDSRTFRITGVMKDFPKQSHFGANFLISMTTFPESHETLWLRSNFITYVLFREGADPKKLAAAFPALLRKYSGAEMQRDIKVTIDEFEKGGSYFKLNLMPLTAIHLHSDMTGEFDHNGNVQYVYIFSAIAIFILLIACVNFMNLSTARSANRAREVGVRKVLGSARKHLIAQFLTESILVTFCAGVIALFAAIALLPLFNNLADKNLVVDVHTLVWLVPAMLAAVLVIGVLAGSYPAFFLSAFQPINVLKGRLSNGFKNSWLRSFLVVFQFSVSIFLIIGTLVIYNQLNYIQTKNLGYNRNQVLVIKKVNELGNQANAFKQEVKQLPGVVNATITGFLPTSLNYRNTAIFRKTAAHDPKDDIFPQVWSVDADYLSTMGMQLAQGRNFSAQMATDSAGVIINEAAARFLGFTDPVNKTLYKTETEQYHIIGVVKDFHFTTLHQNITPVIMKLGEDHSNLSIRYNGTNLNALMGAVRSKWEKMSGQAFEYSFMDADFDATYRAEQRTGNIFIGFAVLAILIACLGLFGLAAYAAEQRTREIGIRKILGANVGTIVSMLSKDFIKLVLIAIVITSPVAWYLMHLWLQDFAYRINVQWWVILAAGLIAIVIAFVTISTQSLKAAKANPVDSLN